MSRPRDRARAAGLEQDAGEVPGPRDEAPGPRETATGPQEAAAGSPVAWAVVMTVAGTAFALLAFWVGRGSRPAVDEEMHRWVLAHRDSFSITVARTATWAGISKIVLPAVFVAGWLIGTGRGVRGRVAAALAAGLTAATGVLAESQVNAVIGRVRPPAADWAGSAGGPAFPSGHTTAATLGVLACAWLLTRRLRPGGPRRAVWAAAVLVAAAVGWSRVWLGVHWPTDVLGGWLFGLAWSAAALALLLAVRQRRLARAAAPG
jgi:membrane-associated phospholipid phosphatase